MILNYCKRMVLLITGLFAYALGIYLCVQANVGLAPWDAFHQGLAGLAGMPMGNLNVASSVVIIALDFWLGEKIGIGSILNGLLIGVFLNLLLAAELLPLISQLWVGLLVQLAGLVTIGFATYFYMKTGLGCGPRDALMVALCRKFPNTSVGVIRGCIEGTVLLLGWLCGATVGIGTVIAVFGLGIIVQGVFKLMKLDVTEIRHENILDTWHIWRGKSSSKSVH